MKLIHLLTEKINKERYFSLLKREMDYDEEEAKEVLNDIIDSVKSLPEEIKLFRIIHVDNEEDINTEQLGSHYSTNKKDLLNSHSFADGVGDQSFLITILTPKKLVDVGETVYNNVLYPHENEVTLKNKGKGVKIVSIKKIR